MRRLSPADLQALGLPGRTMGQLNPADLQAFMLQHAIQGEILSLEVPTPTVETAAQAVGAQPDWIVKGVGRKRVKLATPDVVLRVAGYEAGAMPPFGHLQPIPTLIDPRVLAHPVVYAGGGAENALVRLDSQEILRVTGAQVIDLIEKTEQTV